MVNWQFWVSIALGAFNTVFLAYLQYSVNRFNRSEDQSNDRLKEIRDKLHEASTKLIDERFRAMSHEVNNTAQGFVNAIKRVEESLGDGGEKFEKLGDKAAAFDVKLAQQTGEIKEYIHSQLDAVNGRISELKGDVKVLASKVEAKTRGTS